ncbi:MAG: hypothetical protein K0S28_1950 [Paucimonas sp.]|jgi:uncharacterized membrane protein|nr:hypothetical protein [Paucimonas sp.]
MSKSSRHTRQNKLLIAIRSSLWFFPVAIILLMAVLAIVLVEIDRHYHQELSRWWPRFFATDAEGARAMLTAIASSMATVAGVAFSITIVALVLASTQYSSRVLRTFMRDRATQIVLGMFIGTYLYCLLVLRTMSAGTQGPPPALAVLGGLILAILSTALFIFFIHHISSSIQASEIAARIAHETLHSIDSVFPEEDDGTSASDDYCETLEASAWQPVPAETMGYIQSVDFQALAELAGKYGTVVRMERAIGEFVAPGIPIACLASANAVTQAAVHEFNEAYGVSSYRTIEQDPSFGIRQLVDISLKALSPGINDTTTAITCVDYLSVILSRCAQRRMCVPLRFEAAKPRVIPKTPDFADLASLSFLQILENAKANTEVICRLLTAIVQVSRLVKEPAKGRALNFWAAVIEETAGRHVKEPHSLHKIGEHLSMVKIALAQMQPDSHSAL